MSRDVKGCQKRCQRVDTKDMKKNRLDRNDNRGLDSQSGLYQNNMNF